MKNIILAVAALVAFAQAEDVVHYDKPVKTEGVHYDKPAKVEKSISKVNYPSNEINVSAK